MALVASNSVRAQFIFTGMHVWGSLMGGNARRDARRGFSVRFETPMAAVPIVLPSFSAIGRKDLHLFLKIIQIG